MNWTACAGRGWFDGAMAVIEGVGFELERCRLWALDVLGCSERMTARYISLRREVVEVKEQPVPRLGLDRVWTPRPATANGRLRIEQSQLGLKSGVE
jgi:hypothetical protein